MYAITSYLFKGMQIRFTNVTLYFLDGGLLTIQEFTKVLVPSSGSIDGSHSEFTVVKLDAKSTILALITQDTHASVKTFEVTNVSTMLCVGRKLVYGWLTIELKRSTNTFVGKISISMEVCQSPTHI